MPTKRDRLEAALLEAMRMLSNGAPHDWNHAYDPPDHRADCRYCAWVVECREVLPESMTAVHAKGAGDD